MTMHTTKGTSGKAYGFVGDADTYIASSAANTVDVVAGGTTTLQANASGATVAGSLTLSSARGLTMPSGFATERVAVLDVVGGAASSGVFAAWQNPEGAGIIVTRAIMNVTTKSTGASTLDIGLTAVNATTSSDTLLDGIDSGTAAAVFDSGDAGLDTGANDMAQTLASGKWVTVAEASGNVDGLVGKLFIYYLVA